MVKVLFIDVGILKDVVIKLFSSVLFFYSPGRIVGPSDNLYHASFTLKAFHDEYKDKNVEVFVCGFTHYMIESVYEHCYEISKQNNIKYINISYGPSSIPMQKEAEIIKKWMNDGVKLVLSNGNNLAEDPDTLYPNSICQSYENCYIAAAEELVKRGDKKSKKAIVIKSETCIENVCNYGSSFAAPRLLAKIIKGEVQK